MARYHVAVDTGGTFTDVVLQDTATGRIWATKTATTPGDPSQGFMQGVGKVLAQAGASAQEVARVFHGTTIATNAIIQGRAPGVGLLTTHGFKYVLEIGRHDIPRRENIYGWVQAPRPVPPHLILEVAERVDAAGQVLQPLDDAEVRAAARALKAQGVEAIAVSFLYSYANPSHELRAAALLQEEHPEALVSLSSHVLPQFREYERTVATVLNASVMVHVSRYLRNLEQTLRARGVNGSLFIMKSNGGVASAAQAARQAVHTVLSGPAAGVLGALQIARGAGHPNFISIDVGGTSADICLVRNGAPEVSTERLIADLPLQLPMLDIVTIGAGGGSVARLTGARGLAVGPESAGAEPGPASYRRGGSEPTVTDAHLLLGRLPASLLGGEIPLDMDAAREAILARIARPLGLNTTEAAAGIVEIANNNMSGAIRAVSIGRGYNPADFALVAFGGAGPLHACALASLLGVRTVIIPPAPGVLSTYGLLFTDLKNDYVQTVAQGSDGLDPQAVAIAYARLEIQAQEWLQQEGVGPGEGMLLRSADLRYAHQGFEVAVEVPSGPVSQAAVHRMVEAFHQAHLRLYTYHMPHVPVELVNLRVTALGPLPKYPLPSLSDAPSGQPAPAASRKVLFSKQEGIVETPVYQRRDLPAGAELRGPAIIEQPDTTTVLWPDFRARVDRFGNLVVEPLS
ncbi:MAG: hydantoinase/oxoprolinase family protein [Chloroflexi bacterium]|nr:hydantoinase/oxoprolinase family protein [Chloroflexota bacterium]